MPFHAAAAAASAGVPGTVDSHHHLVPTMQWPTDAKTLDSPAAVQQSPPPLLRPRSSTASSQTCCSVDSLAPDAGSPSSKRRQPQPGQSPSTDNDHVTDDHVPRQRPETTKTTTPPTPPPHPHSRPRPDADTSAPRFPRISRPVELLRASYDCVVIGSGYGGAVAASRLARAGQRVCVLELGKERWPGEYPVTAAEAIPELHCTGQVTPEFAQTGVDINTGKKTGMYHLIFGKGQNAFVCNGLGGTSLINANIFLRADKDTLANSAWPPELRGDSLKKYYEKVESVLEPEPYPADWPALPKLDLLRKQAEQLNLSHAFYRPPQTTRFHNGPNACGVEMQPSTLSGQDATGVNDGSKTTTLVTYLADAWNWGAELFCECEVRRVEKVGADDPRGGYRVYFAWHGRGRPHFGSELENLMWVHARDAVFFGAGAIGTTEILLRSKQGGLPLSDRIGQNMSGNGDMLAFGYNTTHATNAVGRPNPSPYRPVGPTIAGIIDNRVGHARPQDGFVIEEGAIPQALAGVLQTMLELMPGSLAPASGGIGGIVHRAKTVLSAVGSHLLGPYLRQGAVEKTQVYLIMSHDSSQAVLSLADDKPVLEFLGVARSGHSQHIQALLAKATAAVGGTLVGNPFFALLKEQITVHPIGGAAMARDNTGATGASDHAGRLFTGNGSAVHSGLVVMDAAAIPTSLGVNPLATIAALAERSVDHYIQSRGLVARTDSNGILDLFGQPAHAPMMHDNEDDGAAPEESVTVAAQCIERAAHVDSAGFGFTEVMSGFLHRMEDSGEDGPSRSDDDHVRATCAEAYRRAEGLCESARFLLSVQAFDTADLVHDPGHRGMLTGTFVCPTLPGSPFMVQRGTFGLFVEDLQAPGTRNMTYDFDLRGTNGQTLRFHGRKIVDASVALAPLQLWRATSTLYVCITDNRTRPTVVARGIMHIGARDLLSQLRTMAPSGRSLVQKAVSAASFMTYFARKSLGMFWAPLAPLQYPMPSYTGYVNSTPPTKVWTDICARDGICSRLHMWEPEPQYVVSRNGRRGGIPSVLFVPGAAVDHQIFALPTIPFNAVNYFTRAGYRVFVSVHRIGQVVACENNWTTFDARLDLRAALERIREQYGGGDGPAEPGTEPNKIYAVAHCMGSVALAAGLLDGTIPADWLLGLACSQVFMNPIWNTANMIKATAGIGPVRADRVYSMLAGAWLSLRTSPDDTLLQRAINQALRLLPDARHELCSNAACHRASLVFGRCWNHANLNEATHRQTDRFFGGVNMTGLHLLMLQGSQGHVMGNAPLYEVLVTPATVQRLRGLPIFQFVGGDNAVLSARATEKSYEILCDTFGGPIAEPTPDHPDGVHYGRRVIPGYGHLDCWMGRNAWRDVYPVVREAMDRAVHGADYVFAEPDASVCRFTRMMEGGL